MLLASGAAWLRYQPLDQPLDQPLAQQTGVSEVIPSIAVTAPIPATDPDLPVAAGRRLARGERVAGPLDLQWSDGSVGHLAARGTARVPEVDRGVVLEAGELAMTAVPQSSDTPLIVSTAHARCTVIGTRFSVRCAEDTTSLLVDEGRVLFQPIGGEAQLVQAGGQALAGHAQPPSAGLVGWWPLDDGQGDTARDASGQGHPGHLSGPQWTVQGLHFPGGDAHVSIAAHGRLQTVQDGDYSLSAWYLPEVFPTGNGAPSRDALAVIAGRSGWTLGLHLTPDGRFFMQHFLADHQPQTADSPILATPGQWSHVVGVVSRRLGYTQLAVDGVRMPTVTAWTPGAAGNAYAPSQPWVIGIGLPGDAECRWPAQGLIRAVRLYDRALDAHDIVRLAHDR